MSNDELATRIASGELQSLAERMFAQANGGHLPGVCAAHAEQCRAIGCLLLGMDQLIQRRTLKAIVLDSLPIWGPLSVIVAAGTCGMTFAIAKLCGFGP